VTVRRVLFALLPRDVFLALFLRVIATEFYELSVFIGRRHNPRIWHACYMRPMELGLGVSPPVEIINRAIGIVFVFMVAPPRARSAA
jgi:hypothetical protein